MTPAEVQQAPWTLVTSVFMHGSFTHLFFNMFALLIFGFMLERVIGTRAYLLLFLAGGLFANIADYLVTPEVFTAGLGASGAIFAVIGCVALLRPKDVIYVNFFVPMPIIAAAFLFGFLEFISIGAQDAIGHMVHVFGLVFGLLFGLLIMYSGAGQWARFRIKEKTTMRIIYATTAVLLVVAGATAFGLRSFALPDWAPQYVPAGWSVVKLAGAEHVVAYDAPSQRIALQVSGPTSMAECEQAFGSCSYDGDIVIGSGYDSQQQIYASLFSGQDKTYIFVSDKELSGIFVDMKNVFLSG